MADAKSNRHVTVVDVNWARVLLFPRLGRAFPMAAQPGRLMMGFMIVVLLMATGALWDAITGPAVGPAGLTEPAPDDAEMQAILDDFLATSPIAGTMSEQALYDGESFDADDVRDAMIAWYNELSDEDQDQTRDAVNLALDRLDQLRPRGVFKATIDTSIYVFDEGIDLSEPAGWLNAIPTIVEFKVHLMQVLAEHHLTFFIVFGLWFLVLVMLAGGMISRSVACEFAINQYIPWTEALAFALKRWMAILGSVVLPGVLVAIGFLLLAFGGLLLRVPVLDIVGGVLYAVALFGGFLLTAILVLWTLGFGLLVPAIAVESADAPDALSRAFAYVKNRPLHLVWYVLIAGLIGLAGFVVVAGIAWLTINVTAWGATFFPGGDEVAAYATARSLTDFSGVGAPLGLGPTGEIAATLIGLWKTIIGGLVAGYLFSYSWTAWTIIYFLLRKAVDDQDIEEIWLPGMIEGALAPDRAASSAR